MPSSSLATNKVVSSRQKLAGRTDVEDAVLQLDRLTKEESLMAVVRNLEVTHRVDGNVEATKVLTEDIDDNVNATMVLAEDIGDHVKEIDHDLKTTKDSTQRLLSIFVHTDFLLYAKIVTDEVKRSSLPNGVIVERQS